jgi:hypothetical protein
MKVKFLDLGRQPIANKFIESKNEASDEFLFNLGVTFDTDNFLVSLENFVKPELMFNEDYVYHASQSQTMKDHFKEASDEFKLNFNTGRVLEIGSNDGVFLFNFSKSKAVAVEPCGNFARIIKKNGYKVYDKFWTSELASKIKKKEGLFDFIVGVYNYRKPRESSKSNTADVFKYSEVVFMNNGTIEDLRNNNWLINEANLTFYVDQNSDTSIVPEQLFAYNFEENEQITEVS